MMFRGLSRAGRDVFLGKACDLGQEDLNKLKNYLGPDAWGQDQADVSLDSFCVLVGKQGEGGIRLAGGLELLAWMDWLDRPSRRKLRPLVDCHLPYRRRWFSYRERLRSAELESMQAALFAPLSDSLDIGIRAGLHRLARALADSDLEQLSLDILIRQAASARCLRAAHSRLSTGSEADLEARRLRREWLARGGEVNDRK